MAVTVDTFAIAWHSQNLSLFLCEKRKFWVCFDFEKNSLWFYTKASTKVRPLLGEIFQKEHLYFDQVIALVTNVMTTLVAVCNLFNI